MGTFVVETQKPSTFLDKRGEVVQGFLIQGTLLPWNENFNLQVESLSPEIVKPLVEQLIEDRENLDKLSAAPIED